jgi:signal transduction histidine kinase
MKVIPFRLRFNLRTKLTLLIISLVIMLIVVTGILITMQEKKTLEGEIYKRGLALANDLASFAARPLLSNDLATLRRFVNHTMTEDYVLYVFILDPRGKVVMHSDLGEIGKIYHQDLALKAINSEESGCIHNPARECNIYAPINVAEARLGTVIMGYSYAGVKQEIAKARRQIVSIGLITITIGGLIAYLLAAFISLPIKKITASMAKVSQGDLTDIPDINRHDEIGVLVKAFNRMAADLKKHRQHLEVLVEARTTELSQANAQLHQEIAERRRAEDEVKRSRQQLRDLASHLEVVREEERIRIAREIHDELGQALTALKMDVHWLGSRLPGHQELLLEKISSMSKLINTTVQAVRRISTELRPGLLDDFGLSAAIEWQANEFCRRAGINCDLSSEPEEIILDQARSTALFRIFQETLTNIARHAEATEVVVNLTRDTFAVELEVRDNGKGITAAQINAGTSFGLMGIRERVLKLDGDLRISGAPEKGTRVHVTLPLGPDGKPV